MLADGVSLTRLVVIEAVPAAGGLDDRALNGPYRSTVPQDGGPAPGVEAGRTSPGRYTGPERPPKPFQSTGPVVSCNRWVAIIPRSRVGSAKQQRGFAPLPVDSLPWRRLTGL